MNILFVRLSYIGDILHATAAARWIKQRYPNAILHWIVTPSMAELLEHNPYVDHIIPWERDVYEAHSKKLHLCTMWNMWWDLRKQLQPYQFDIAVDVQGRLITGLVLLATGAPIRLGLGGTKELNWLFTNYKSKDRSKHVIEQYLEVAQLLPMAIQQSSLKDRSTVETSNQDLLANDASETTRSDESFDDINQMDLFVTDEEQQQAQSEIAHVFTDEERPTIGIVLGSSWQTKSWPSEKWQQLIESMSYRSNFICFGGPKEEKDFTSLMQYVEKEELPVYNKLGKTTLREMAALLQACDVVVSCDTGALHMAIALNRPVVALFGPTNPAEWGPLTGLYRVIQNHDMDCLGCRKRKCPKGKAYCMSGIDPIWVKENIIELLDVVSSEVR